MKKIGFLYLLIIPLLTLLSGCIHEYPYPVPGPSKEPGENPVKVIGILEVSFDLTWQQILHKIDFKSETRARTEKPHRFIIEVTEDGELVCRDEIFLSENEFISGRTQHRLSTDLEAKIYNIAVWYDIESEDNTYSFDADHLSNIMLLNTSTRDIENLQCAFASDYLDLRDYDTASSDSVIKELELTNAGARFEIVASDVQQFILDNKEALNQDDKFTVHLSFSSGAYGGFNLHDESVLDSGENLEFSGWMRLPFAEYDELKIAEGFIFCRPEDTASVRLWVTNTALLTVSATDYFTFPVKRGYITTITGDFLTNPIEGIFSVNHIWEGEIIIEI